MPVALRPLSGWLLLFFIQMYMFLASNWFPIFLLTFNTIFEVKKIQMNLKCVLKNIFLWYFTFWSLRLFLITWQGLSFFGELSRYFSKNKFQTCRVNSFWLADFKKEVIWANLIMILWLFHTFSQFFVHKKCNCAYSFYDIGIRIVP